MPGLHSRRERKRRWGETPSNPDQILRVMLTALASLRSFDGSTESRPTTGEKRERVRPPLSQPPGQLAGLKTQRLSMRRKKPVPVFSRSAEVFGPGHGCFVKSPDGQEDWIIYHAAKHRGAGWNRHLRAQKFTWQADGSPDFGLPVPAGMPLPAPSGRRARLP